MLRPFKINGLWFLLNTVNLDCVRNLKWKFMCNWWTNIRERVEREEGKISYWSSILITRLTCGFIQTYDWVTLTNFGYFNHKQLTTPTSN
jgi:hypothetical protein